MDEIMKDARFSHIFTDPRFRKMPRSIQRVSVDKRFKGMFKDQKFKEKCIVDKRGRPLNLMPTENLKNLYSITSESSDDDNHQSAESDPDTGITQNECSIIVQKGDKQSIKSEKSGKKLSNKFVLDEEKCNSNESLEKNFKKDKKHSKKLTNKGQKLYNVESKVEDTAKILTNIDKMSSGDDHKNDGYCCSVSGNTDSNYLDKSKKSKSVSKEKKFQKNNSELPNEFLFNKGFYESPKSVKHLNKSNRISDADCNNDVMGQVLDKEVNNSITKIKKKSKDLVPKFTLPEVKNPKNDTNADDGFEDEEHDIGDTMKIAPEESSSDSTEDSDESDESESEDSSVGEEDFDHRWEELREDAPDTDQITRRLAVCNMDWDRIRAEDLFAAFDSFKPPNGCIHSVKVFPSEFGLKRMEEEKLHGPPELVEETLDNEEVEDPKGSKYHREKLRQYQINRLKYYYAVIDCDSPETANTLYEQLNGMEYESSSIRFDIRFIPDDITFDHEPSSVADKAPDPTEYKPRLFVTTALQQVKVNLTWDETDPKRRETLQKAFTEPESIEKDIRDYLASSSSESEGDAEENDVSDGPKEGKLTTKERILKYRELLQSLEEKDKEDENKYEMEITWEPGLKEKTEEIVKEKVQKESLNPFEELLKKKKEGKKLRKKEKKALSNKVSEGIDSSLGNSDSEYDSESSTHKEEDKRQDTKKLAELALMSDSRKADFFERKVNRKAKKDKKLKLEKSKVMKYNEDKLDSFKCDVNDPRFSAIYSSHLYNIDPSDPHFKKTEGSLALIQEKQKRIKHGESDLKQVKNPKKAKYF